MKTALSIVTMLAFTFGLMPLLAYLAYLVHSDLVIIGFGLGLVFGPWVGATLSTADYFLAD